MLIESFELKIKYRNIKKFKLDFKAGLVAVAVKYDQT
jgi:hypothetical protein